MATDGTMPGEDAPPIGSAKRIKKSDTEEVKNETKDREQDNKTEAVT